MLGFTKVSRFLSLFFILGNLGWINSFQYESDFNIFLTINAKNRRMEVNWLSGPIDPQNKLIITDKPVESFGRESLDIKLGPRTFVRKIWKAFPEDANILYENSLQGDTGRIQTSIRFRDDYWRELDYTKKCYGYWFYYVNPEGKILTNGCQGTQPTWMNEMKDKIKDARINQLFIPGTHDAGSYREDFRLIEKETIVTKYAFTQDEYIRSQLIHGIRYVDIRVAYYLLDKDKFWVNHGVYKMNPLVKVLRQVREFVEATNEIVIFDIHEFPYGFDIDEVAKHRKLVNLLKDELGPYAVDASKGWDLTLEDIWKQGKNIIIGYDFGQMRNEFPDFLFLNINHRWGNVQSLQELIDFMRRTRSENQGNTDLRPFSDMAQLTPTAGDVILDKLGGLRNMADMVNFEMGKLYRTEFGFTSNIVSIDFYHSSNVVSNSLYWNQKKFYS